MLGLILFSCGESDDASGEEGECGAKIEVSAEMSDFIGGFNGSYTAVEAGLEKYGATEEIVDHDMGMYDLKDPKVTAKDGDCYTVVCKSGMVENTYNVCWEGGKIVSITGG